MYNDLTDLQAAKSVDMQAYIEKHTTLKKISAHEWVGKCPRCGGTDRFHYRDDRGCFCRRCFNDRAWYDIIDFVMWLDGIDLPHAIRKINGNENINQDELDRRIQYRRNLEEERKKQDAADQQRARDELASGKAWEIYYHNLDKYPEARELWHKRGLSDEWIRYYQLGYCPDRNYPYDDKNFHSASLTIPYWRAGLGAWTCIGLRHRLLDDNSPGGKYRPHLSGLGNHLFYTDPMVRNMFGDVLVVEGEIKAMVTWATLWDEVTHDLYTPNLWVVGIPGKSWKPEYLEALAGADRVFVCLDPDAGKEARRMVSDLNGRGRLIELPGKIDDLILQGVIDPNMLLEILQ